MNKIKAQQIDSAHHHEGMVKMQTSDKAKERFRRKPYSGTGIAKNKETKEIE